MAAGNGGGDVEPFSPADRRFQVLAAAGGGVVGVRDGQEDSPIRNGDTSRQGRECGNGVRIDHGGGWTTQYCHLRRNSVTVNPGTRVEAGDVLGTVGASGQTDPPRLHFQAERNRTPVDPFTGNAAARPVSGDATGSLAGTLWSSPAWRELADYEPVVVYRAAYRTGRPDQTRALYEGYPRRASTTAGSLVGYVVLLGATRGSTVDTLIVGPNDDVIYRNRAEVPRDFARYFAFAGTPRYPARWRSGIYEAPFVVATPDGGYSTEAITRIVLR